MMKKIKKNKKGGEPVDKNEEELSEESVVSDQPQVSVEPQSTPEVESSEQKELQEKLLRIMAEFDNFRKRTQKEKSGMYEMGVTDTLEKLLPVIDNFDRALISIPSDSDIKKGIEMIYRQFEDILKNLGLQPIDCIGKEFDAKFHNAVAQGQEEDKPSQTILEELQKGYIYKEKVIRHSMVKVNS